MTVSLAGSRGGGGSLGASGRRPLTSSLAKPTAAKRSASQVFLVRWINHVCGSYLGWTPVTAESFYEDLSKGLILCRLVERLVPGADFSKGLFLKPVSKRSCLSNLERALSVAWRQSASPTHMCTAEDFYRAKDPREAQAQFVALRCVAEFFVVLQMRQRDGRARMRDVLRKMQDLLDEQGLPLSPQTLAGDVPALNQDFRSGNRVVAVLLATGAVPGEDALPEMWDEDECAKSKEKLAENGRALCQVLHSAGCPLLLASHEWRSPPQPSPDSLVFQLFVIWDFCMQGRGAQGRLVNAPKEQIIAGFAAFMCGNFSSSREAFDAISQNNMDRMSRSHFNSAMKHLGYSGDLKFMWHTFDMGSPKWFITFQDWDRLLSEGMAHSGARWSGEAAFAYSAGPGLWPVSEEPSPAATLHPAWPPSSPTGDFESPSPKVASARGILEQRSALTGSFGELMLDNVTKGEEPTSSIDVRLELTDSTERRVWLRTNVISVDNGIFSRSFARSSGAGELLLGGDGDRGQGGAGGAVGDASLPTSPGARGSVRSDAGSPSTAAVEEGGAALVLELRERSGVEGVVAKVDVRKIVAIERIDDAEVSGGGAARSGEVAFVVAMRPGADLHGADPGSLGQAAAAEARTTAPSMYHAGNDDTVLMIFSAGPAPRLRKEALRFFEELRIMLFFLQGHGRSLEAFTKP